MNHRVGIFRVLVISVIPCCVSRNKLFDHISAVVRSSCMTVMAVMLVSMGRPVLGFMRWWCVFPFVSFHLFLAVLLVATVWLCI